MNCSRCGSVNYCKDGFVKSRQRYQCKDCHYRYTVERKSDVKTEDIQRRALEMYLEGLGFRAIGRLLKISYGTVYCWVKEWGAKVSLPKKTEATEVIELDEMHTYIGQKQKPRQRHWHKQMLRLK